MFLAPFFSLTPFSSQQRRAARPNGTEANPYQPAEAAVIVSTRHQETGRESMKIPRTKGRGREVRRTLTQRSRARVDPYRGGQPAGDGCPLRRPLATAGRLVATEQPAMPRRFFSADLTAFH